MILKSIAPRRPIRVEQTGWPFSGRTRNRAASKAASFESFLSPSAWLLEQKFRWLVQDEGKPTFFSHAGFESRAMRFSGPKSPWSRNRSKSNSTPLSFFLHYSNRRTQNPLNRSDLPLRGTQKTKYTRKGKFTFFSWFFGIFWTFR